jgi:hypothetical protein
MTAAIVFAVLSALSNACSAILQRLAVVNRAPGGRPVWRTAIDLVRQPVWLLGALFLIGTFGFQALGLYFGPLSVVQPILVLELIFTLGLRVFLLHDDIALRTWSAALTICLGLAASQATLLIVDPLASIALGLELFQEHLNAGPAYVAGVIASLAVLGTGVVMLSIWAPPVMTAEELTPLRHGQVHRSKDLTDASSVV